MLYYLIYLGMVSFLIVLFSRWNWDFNNAVRKVAGASLLLVASFTVLLITRCPWFGDFDSAYYPAGKLVFDAPEKLYQLECAAGFVNIPIVAVPLRPLSNLSYRNAVVLFTLMGVSSTLLAGWLVYKLFKANSQDKWWIATLLAVNGPLFYSIREGNTTHVCFLLICMAIWAHGLGRIILAGVILGVAATIKIPLAIFSLYFFLRGDWKALFGMLFTAASLVGLSLAVHGQGLHHLWFQNCIAPFSSHAIAGFNEQSTNGVLARIYGFSSMDWTPRLQTGSLPSIRHLLNGVLIASTAFVFWRKGRPKSAMTFTLEMSSVLVLTVLISPISWTHYYSLLLLPIIVLIVFAKRDYRNFVSTLPLALVTLALSLPLQFPLKSASGWVQWLSDKVLVSHYFFSGVVLLGMLLNHRWKSVQKTEPLVD